MPTCLGSVGSPGEVHRRSIIHRSIAPPIQIGAYTKEWRGNGEGRDASTMQLHFSAFQQWDNPLAVELH